MKKNNSDAKNVEREGSKFYRKLVKFTANLLAKSGDILNVTELNMDDMEPATRIAVRNLQKAINDVYALREEALSILEKSKNTKLKTKKTSSTKMIKRQERQPDDWRDW